MTAMMYHYWVHGRLRPSFFSEMSQNELTIIRAFFELEVEEINQLGEV
ncbi:hypothetical protein [Metabacillus sp. B2-18]|nr:hypothetical protein [Metabacillus sp. B2-18]UGB31710.1 hypothetical protein LPC09_04300 [Metabacillus sp. B2-18]